MNDQDDVLRVIRELKDVGGKTKPMATEIASHLRWGGGGSSQRLNGTLQALRRAGKIEYVRGTGWVELKASE